MSGTTPLLWMMLPTDRASATAEATDDRHSFLSGTVLRCTPFHHTSPGRGPGLTENGSALRTGTSALVNAAN